MRRLLAVAALVAGTVVVSAPPAAACEFSQCPWGRVICSIFGCPPDHIMTDVDECLLVAPPYACLP